MLALAIPLSKVAKEAIAQVPTFIPDIHKGGD